MIGQDPRQAANLLESQLNQGAQIVNNLATFPLRLAATPFSQQAPIGQPQGFPLPPSPLPSIQSLPAIPVPQGMQAFIPVIDLPSPDGAMQTVPLGLPPIIVPQGTGIQSLPPLLIPGGKYFAQPLTVEQAAPFPPPIPQPPTAPPFTPTVPFAPTGQESGAQPVLLGAGAQTSNQPESGLFIA